MGRGACQATVHRVTKKLDTTEAKYEYLLGFLAKSKKFQCNNIKCTFKKIK